MSLPGGDSYPPPPLPVKQSSLPIARSTGASYDRPERARTSHACEPCRERKTKCDGERPSCRRCMHTGTNCHYGYGKGWRKRKTAEDLTATSRRLARYEALLNDIMPHVTPNVKAMIEEARELDAAASTSGGSETTETNDTPRSMYGLNDMGATSNSRVSLPFPVPTLGAQTPLAHPPPLARPFEPGSARSANVSRSLASASPDEPAAARLPSITPHGLLIEPSLAAQTGHHPQAASDPALYARDHSMADSQSPPTKTHQGEWIPFARDLFIDNA